MARRVQLVKNFKWTNEDQNLVAGYITNQGMTPEKAAEKWVAEHEATWKPWIPALTRHRAPVGSAAAPRTRRRRTSGGCANRSAMPTAKHCENLSRR